jgi:hypothetical protein
MTYLRRAPISTFAAVRGCAAVFLPPSYFKRKNLETARYEDGLAFLR